MRRGFKQAAERQALAFRGVLGLAATAPLPAVQLADHLAVTLISVTDIPCLPTDDLRQLVETDSESWSAITLPIEESWLVISNPVHSAARQESNLMHELAHLICEHRPGRLHQIEGIPFPVREYDDNQEEEAAWLGGCLQIPRTAMLRSVERGMSNEQIAEHFGASLQLVRYRRNVTGVDVQLRRRSRRRSAPPRRRSNP